MEATFGHWRRAKIGRRFRLFFRFDSNSRIIALTGVNDDHTLRCAGSRSDPYAASQKMLQRSQQSQLALSDCLGIGKPSGLAGLKKVRGISPLERRVS